MAGKARVELTSDSPELGFGGSYPNGPRSNYPGPSLDRPGSFREGGENRMFSSGAGTARVTGMLTGNLPPLSQCLMLEPIIMSHQKCTRSGELRRVLGFSVGSALQDNAFGAAHSRPSPLVAREELKRYKESIVDANNNARSRAKKLDEHLHKLNKYFEVINSKKQLKNELSTNERSGGLNLKMGTQIRRNPPDLATQKVEDQPKNAVPNKRVRTSVAETRVECRSNGLARQPLVMAKDRDMLKNSSPGSDPVEEKVRRLPTGGEGWDKKMKRKRSVGTAFTRPVDSDREWKRPIHPKGGNESGLQSCDARGFRSGSSISSSGTKRLDGISLPASSVARATPRHEQERATLMSDLTAGLSKEKLLAKGNNKLNIREDNHMDSPSPVTKGKASRAPRSGSVVATNSSPNIPCLSGAPECWEQPPSVNKIHSIGGANNHTRVMPLGSSSPPMAQWVGQRPHKISRTRRANLVSPVSSHEEMQISSEGCSPSDFGARINSSGINGLLQFKGMGNGAQQFKVKVENVSSPARFSESEESGVGENRLKEKVLGNGELEEKAVSTVQNSGPPAFLAKKEEISDGVQRLGRSGRGSSFSMASISPVREKLENRVTTKPLPSTRPGTDKNRSKTGRPLKRLLDRKGFSRRGHVPSSSSPDFTGESDDYREELLAAATLARNASCHACSSSFWKKMEPIFAPVSLQDISYFSLQGDLAHEVISASETVGSAEIDRNLRNQIRLKESARMVDFVDQFENFDTSCGILDSERRPNNVIPLYQRVLSALIVEDEIEECEEYSIGRNASLQYATNGLCCNAEPRKRSGMEFECESTFGAQTWKQCAGNRFFSCNGSDSSNRNPLIQNPPQNDELFQGESGFVHSQVGVVAGLSSNDLDGPQVVQTNGFSLPAFGRQYEKMCMEDKLMLELQSIGLQLDRVPDLDDKEDEVINEEIVQLKEGLYQQIGKKKACLDKVCKAFQQEKEAEARELEQLAMDRIVELAYKKLLATRGSIASKWGIAKVSKQVALAFAKRTLAGCLEFEASGKSCFNEPALRDVLFAAPPRASEAEPSTCDHLEVGNNKLPESQNPVPYPRALLGSFHSSAEWHDLHRDSLDAFENFTHQSDQSFAKKGPTSNRGKKKELLLDDVGGNAALRNTSILGSTLLGGAKGKRSERERDKDMSSRNAVARAGRPSLSNFRGERKSKTKPKQKTAQPSTSVNGFVNKFTETTQPVYPSATGSGGLVTSGSNTKREARLMSPSTIPQDSSKETKEAMDFTNLQLPELDSIDELGVGTDLGGPQDLSSLLNFDEDGLQEYDSAGLSVPWDDLYEVF